MKSTKDAAMRWRSWPARERPLAAAGACGALLVLAAGVALTTGDWMWGALALLGMFIALIRFFLPSDVEVTDEKITLREPLRVRTLPWSEVRGCIDGGDAMLLTVARSRRSLRGSVQVPLGRGEAVAVRKHCIQDRVKNSKVVEAARPREAR
jgi:hypothetical protein